MALSEKQQEFFNVILSKKHLYMMYGGSIRSGKTYLVLGFADKMCMDYPGIRVGVIRKTISTIRKNTWPTLHKIRRNHGYEHRFRINKQDNVAYYENGSEIVFLGLDIATDPEMNDLRGLELTFAILEEANEVDHKVFTTTMQRVGQWENNVDGKYQQIPPMILLTTNPSETWVKRVFYERWRNGTLPPDFYYQPALPQDNPWNTEQWLKSQENLPEADYERYMLGNWDYSDIPNQLIPYQFLKDTYIPEEEVKANLASRTPQYLGIDVAREGDDATVFCFGDNQGILWFEEYRYKKTNITAEVVQQKIREYNMPHSNVIIDGIGVGAALLDSLDSLSITPTVFKSTDKAIHMPKLKKFSFKNKRAEAFWLMRDDVIDGNITMPYNEKFQTQALKMEYLSPEQYIQMVAKDKLKKKLGGESPDYFESAVMMNYIRHGYGWSGISFDYLDEDDKNQSMLKRQDVVRDYDTDGKVKREHITNVYGERLAPALSHLNRVSSMQY